MPSVNILEGDSLLVLRTLPSASFDCILTDPPYCSGGRTSAERTTRDPVDKYQNSDVKIVRSSFDGDTRDQRGYVAWCALWLAECYRLANPGAPIGVFSDWRQLPATTDALQAGGWTWRGIAVWDKGGGARPQRGRYTAQAEYLIWGSKGAMPASRNVGTLSGVFKHPVRQADKFHLTGKPTDLMRELVQICEPGGHILDPFAGSGTTGVAAALEGYDCTLIELAAENAAICRERYAAVFPGENAPA